MRENYKGYQVIKMTDEELSQFYEGRQEKYDFSLVENEFLLIEDSTGKVVDKYCNQGGKLRPVRWQPIESKLLGKLKPRNNQQELAFDLLQDRKIPVKFLTGTWGSFKTGSMVAHALDLIEKGEFQKIVWVRTNVTVEGLPALGALPGTALEKMWPFAGPLMDHLGGYEMLESYINQNKIEIQHLGFIRGRSFDNSIILCSEIQNATAAMMKLIISRAGENTEVWCEGDTTQTDAKQFRESQGLLECIDSLKGNKLVGYVDLPITERSEVARLADLI